MTTIYLTGPMTGIPDFNYPLFNQEAAKLRTRGLEVINPAEFPKQDTWEDYMRLGLAALAARASALVLLPDWQLSRGATAEIYVAAMLRIPRIPIDDELSLESLILHGPDAIKQRPVEIIPLPKQARTMVAF